MDNIALYESDTKVRCSVCSMPRKDGESIRQCWRCVNDADSDTDSQLNEFVCTDCQVFQFEPRVNGPVTLCLWCLNLDEVEYLSEAKKIRLGMLEISDEEEETSDNELEQLLP